LKTELEQVEYPNRLSCSWWDASDKFIYVGNDQRGYEIWVYDFAGNLIRKIRKEFSPIEIPQPDTSRLHPRASRPRNTNWIDPLIILPTP